MLIALPLLIGCGTVPSDQTKPAPQVICVPIPTYTAADQAKVVDELAALPADTIIGKWIDDYGTMRARLKAGGCPTP